MFGKKKKSYQKKKIYCRAGKRRIFGEALIPEGEGPFPLVIYSHGCGYNTEVIPMSTFAAEGIATYFFDFCGGCPWSNSSGKVIDMSAMTEAEDLEAVIDTLQQQSFVDTSKIFLMGFDQGGFVSTVVAARRAEEIRGMILFAPSYMLPDFQQVFLNHKPVPDTIRFNNMVVGRKYVEDVQGYDIYEDMRKYPGPVLLYQGSEDEMVPLRYIQMAADCFTDVKCSILADARHALQVNREGQLEQETLEFIRKHL